MTQSTRLCFDLNSLKANINKFFNEENERVRALNPQDVVETPQGFLDVAEFALSHLLEEGHFTVEDNNFVLNWDELTLEYMFEDALNFIKNQDPRGVETNVDDLCKVSDTFRTHQTEAVAVATFKAFDAMVEYDTEISDSVFGFQFHQVKRSYQQASQRNTKLGDFDTKLQEMFGAHLSVFLARAHNCRLRAVATPAA